MLNKTFDLKNILESFTDLRISELLDVPKKQTKKEALRDHSKEIAGVYIFWWTGSKESLGKLNRRIRLKGKVADENIIKGANKEHVNHDIECCTNWFPEEVKDRYALYVGKSTKLANRFALHLKMGTSHEDWRKSLLTETDIHGKKIKIDYHSGDYLKLHSPTTSCQFRSGIELLLIDELDEKLFWKTIEDNICYSFYPLNSTDQKTDTDMPIRFYLEDYLIGKLRPWFNLDCER